MTNNLPNQQQQESLTTCELSKSHISKKKKTMKHSSSSSAVFDRESSSSYSLADRMASLEVSSPSCLSQNTNPAKRRSLRENTVFLKDNSKSKKTTDYPSEKKPLVKPPLGIYVPPHRRGITANQNVASDLHNSPENEIDNVFCENPFDVDEF